MTDDHETTDDRPFRMVGGAGGPTCEGDVCEVPALASVDVEQLNP